MRNIQDSQQGVGLVEVLVALLVLALAVLGYAALQGQAVKVTDESLDRSQSLVVMQNIAEKIRVNPTAITTYKEKLAASGNTAPTNKCGLDGTVNTANSAVFCNPTQLAEADSYFIKKELENYGFSIQIHPCPNTGGKKADNIMYSYCLLAAWGDTKPTIGADTDKKHCLTDDGTYYSNATCMMMEL